jgi:hypothetical protein
VNKIYLIGSLRNPEIPRIGNYLRELGFNVFDDWFAGGKIADDEWQAYEQLRGRPYDVALQGYAAQHVYNFDLHHIDDSDIGVLVLPAGKSGHLELGYMIGRGKPGYVLFNAVPERWDVMYNFAHGVYFDVKELGQHLLESHS